MVYQLKSLLVVALAMLLCAGCGGDATAVSATPVTASAAVPDWDSVDSLEEAAVEKDVPYVPTPPEVVAEMLRLADLDERDLLYDLGSGDGRIVITAAQRFGSRGVGIEIDPRRIEEANENAKTAGVTERVRFEQRDLFQADLSDATAVTLYLLSSVNLRLRPTLLEQLKPGTPVVSHEFSMGDWEPDSYADVGRTRVYRWTIPARVNGRTVRWTAADGTQRAVRLEQTFQKVRGSVTVGGRALPLEGRLNGNEIVLEVANEGGVERYSGRLNGNRIEGTVEVDGRRSPWRADV